MADILDIKKGSIVLVSHLISLKSTLTGELVQIVNYLTKKIASKSAYDERQKSLAAKREYERLYGPFRYTRGASRTF